jgi:hypothetical protein
VLYPLKIWFFLFSHAVLRSHVTELLSHAVIRSHVTELLSHAVIISHVTELLSHVVIRSHVTELLSHAVIRSHVTELLSHVVIRSHVTELLSHAVIRSHVNELLSHAVIRSRVTEWVFLFELSHCTILLGAFGYWLPATPTNVSKSPALVNTATVYSGNHTGSYNQFQGKVSYYWQSNRFIHVDVLVSITCMHFTVWSCRALQVVIDAVCGIYRTVRRRTHAVK